MGNTVNERQFENILEPSERLFRLNAGNVCIDLQFKNIDFPLVNVDNVISDQMSVPNCNDQQLANIRSPDSRHRRVVVSGTVVSDVQCSNMCEPFRRLDNVIFEGNCCKLTQLENIPIPRWSRLNVMCSGNDSKRQHPSNM